MTTRAPTELPPRHLFWFVLPLCAAVAAFGIARPERLATAARHFTGTVYRSLDWFFILSATMFLGVCLFLAASPMGRRKLGRDDDTPEYATGSWLAMLFSSGIGAGLLLWGVAEPVSHYTSPPLGVGGTPAAARQAMVLTSLHWGLHAWAIYCIGALALGYFGYRYEAPYLAGEPIRRAFQGRWVAGAALAADVVAVVAGAFGVAASIALGILQLTAGLHLTTHVAVSDHLVLGGVLGLFLLVLIVAMLTNSDKTIGRLSDFNILVSGVLLTCVLFLGPTSFLLRTFVTTVGDYLSAVVGLAFRTFPYEHRDEWLRSWTLSYFIWWIAWAPFVSTFIARISRGRTIREVVLAVLFAPSLLSIFWFSVFGGSGLYDEMSGEGGVARVVSENVTGALFFVLQRLPVGIALSAVAIALIFTFLATSLSSASVVLGMLTSGGTLRPTTTRKIAWGVILISLSAALVLVENIQAVRALAVLGAIPFTFVLLLQMAALLRGLFRGSDVHEGAQ